MNRLRICFLLLAFAPLWAVAQPPPPPSDSPAALFVQKNDSADNVATNVEFNYVIQVLNYGGASATNVVLHDRLPTNLTFVSAASSFGTITQATTNVYFSITNLTGGSLATVTVRVRAVRSGLLTNLVSASAANFTNPVFDTETTYILSDLRVTVSDSADPVQRGDTYAYSLVFSNAGSALVTNVVATNQLPEQVTFLSATSSVGTVTIGTSRVVFALGDLAPGATATATIRVEAVRGGLATNRVDAKGFVSGALLLGLGEGATRILGTTSDLNGDGVGDLLMQSEAGVLYVQAMNGTEGSGGFFPLDDQDIRPWQIAATADLNRDGVPELIARDGGEHLVGYLSSGRVAVIHHLFKAPADLSPWFVVAGGDLDGDGFGDLVMQRGDSGVYAVVLQRSNVWTAVQYLTGRELNIDPWRVVAAADTDGDARADLVLREGNSGVYGIVRVDGWKLVDAFHLTGARKDVRPWTFRAATDLDGDGFDELVFQNGSASRYAAAFMDGFTILKSPLLFTNGLDVSTWRVVGPR